MSALRQVAIALVAVLVLASGAALAATPARNFSTQGTSSSSSGSDGHHFGNDPTFTNNAGGNGGTGTSDGSDSLDDSSLDSADGDSTSGDNSDTSGNDSTTDDSTTDDSQVVDDGDLPSGDPVLGESVGVGTVSGVVLVKMPGTSEFVDLPADGDVPSGAVVDTSDGVAALVTALPDGGTQVARLWGGAVKITQAADGMTDLFLTGNTPVCPAQASSRRAARRASASKARRSTKPVSRVIWVKDNHGRFRSHGKNSVATVRGTQWMTRDTCNGTLTVVREGKVAVKDLHTRRTKLVTAGKRFFAPSHRR